MERSYANFYPDESEGMLEKCRLGSRSSGHGTVKCCPPFFFQARWVAEKKSCNYVCRRTSPEGHSNVTNRYSTAIVAEATIRRSRVKRLWINLFVDFLNSAVIASSASKANLPMSGTLRSNRVVSKFNFLPSAHKTKNWKGFWMD